MVRVEREAGAPLFTKGLELFLELRPEAFPAERAHQEFQPVALLVLVVPEPVEHTDDRLRDVQHLAHRREVEQLVT